MKSLLNKIVLWTIALLLADSRAQALDSQLALTNAALPSGFPPTDANTIYASSGGRLKISRDRGKTFAPTGNLGDSLGGEIGILNWIFSQLPSVFDFAQHRVGGCQIHPRFCLDRNRHFKLHVAAGQRLR